MALSAMQRQRHTNVMKTLRDFRPEEIDAMIRDATAAAAEEALRRGAVVVGTDENGQLQARTTEPAPSKENAAPAR